MRPAQFLLREGRREFYATPLRGTLVVLLLFVEPLEEQQKAQLLDRIERIRQSSGPELVPEGIDGGAQIGIGQHEAGSKIRLRVYQ